MSNSAPTAWRAPCVSWIDGLAEKRGMTMRMTIVALIVLAAGALAQGPPPGRGGRGQRNYCLRAPDRTPALRTAESALAKRYARHTPRREAFTSCLPNNG